LSDDSADSERRYPAKDFPYTFYFNGMSLPRWAQCWYATNLLDLSADALKSWGPSNFDEADTLTGRLDHVGIVESADPLRFRNIAMQFAVTTLAQRDSVVHSIEPYTIEFQATTEDVFAGIQEGLWHMIELVSRDRVAFWTVGYEADCILIAEAIRRHRLATDHPDFQAAPHLQREQSDADRRWDWLRKEAIEKITEGNLSKEDRRRILALPKTDRGPHHPRNL
jgi:hypothetical protein